MTSNHPIWLSILVPVYNVAPYLDACIDSIVGQIGDDSGIEIILVDDASTDGSLALAQIWADAHPAHIRLLRHVENAGHSAARNTMLNIARGDYIWFIDSDDMLMPNAVNALRDVITKHSPDMVICDFHKGNGRRHRSYNGPEMQLVHDREALLAGVFRDRKLFPWLRIVRRQLWGEMRFPVGKCFEDISTTPWLLLRAESHFYVPQIWIYYRQRTGSIMAATKNVKSGFNKSKNDDLACALLGFKHDLRAEFPTPNAETDYWISYFCAKQFTNIAWRLVRSRQHGAPLSSIAPQVAHYRDTLEASAPLSFDALAKAYLARGNVLRFVLLQIFRKLGENPSATALERPA